MTAYGEKRRVVYFNLEKQTQRQIFEFSRSIDFGREVKQFLALRMRGVTLQAMIANAQHVVNNQVATRNNE